MSQVDASLVGKKNVYTCETCHGQTVTVDRDKGVTPFMIGCRAKENCRGMMRSGFYRDNQDLEPTHEWYKPDATELQSLKPGVKDHVKQGGLILRQIQAATTNIIDPNKPVETVIHPPKNKGKHGYVTRNQARATETVVERKSRLEKRRLPTGLPRMNYASRGKYIPAGPNSNIPAGNR